MFCVSLSCDGVVECCRILLMTLFLDLAICYGCDNIYLSYFLSWLNQLYWMNVNKKLGSTKGQVADRPWPSWHCRILLKGKSIRRSVAKDVPCSKSACMYLFEFFAFEWCISKAAYVPILNVFRYYLKHNLFE